MDRHVVCESEKVFEGEGLTCTFVSQPCRGLNVKRKRRLAWEYVSTKRTRGILDVRFRENNRAFNRRWDIDEIFMESHERVSLIVGESKVDYSIFLFRRKLEVSGVFFILVEIVRYLLLKGLFSKLSFIDFWFWFFLTFDGKYFVLFFFFFNDEILNSCTIFIFLHRMEYVFISKDLFFVNGPFTNPSIRPRIFLIFLILFD